MTDEEIDALPAGREMDALVVHHVLKWSLSDRGFYAPPGLPESYYGPYNFKPSTDIAAAWGVVEYCVSRFGFFTLMVGFVEGGKTGYTAIVGACSEAHGDTAPLTICRAALRFVNYA